METCLHVSYFSWRIGFFLSFLLFFLPTGSGSYSDKDDSGELVPDADSVGSDDVAVPDAAAPLSFVLGRVSFVDTTGPKLALSEKNVNRSSHQSAESWGTHLGASPNCPFVGFLVNQAQIRFDFAHRLGRRQPIRVNSILVRFFLAV